MGILILTNKSIETLNRKDEFNGSKMPSVVVEVASKIVDNNGKSKVQPTQISNSRQSKKYKYMITKPTFVSSDSTVPTYQSLEVPEVSVDTPSPDSLIGGDISTKGPQEIDKETEGISAQSGTETKSPTIKPSTFLDEIPLPDYDTSGSNPTLGASKPPDAATTNKIPRPLLETMAGLRDKALLRMERGSKNIKKPHKLGGMTKTSKLPGTKKGDSTSSGDITKFFHPYL